MKLSVAGLWGLRVAVSVGVYAQYSHPTRAMCVIPVCWDSCS